MSGRPITWVIGRGGLLGQHLEAVARRTGAVYDPGSIPWSDPDQALSRLSASVDHFFEVVGDARWQVAWCAGAGVTGTGAHALGTELRMLEAVTDRLATAPRQAPRGALFLASSAGAVYAGAGAAPFNEHSAVQSISAYGHAKLQAEAVVREFSQRTGTPALIGRIANLYGPGQNLDKPQGLISQICRAHLLRQPLSIYVSLDTVRDYLFAQDCGELICAGLDRLRAGDKPLVTKLFASQRGVTVGAVLGEMRRLFKRSPRIVLGSSPATAMQARDLRMRSVVWPELDRRPLTPLPVGIAATAAHLLRSIQRSAA